MRHEISETTGPVATDRLARVATMRAGRVSLARAVLGIVFASNSPCPPAAGEDELVGAGGRSHTPAAPFKFDIQMWLFMRFGAPHLRRQPSCRAVMTRVENFGGQLRRRAVHFVVKARFQAAAGDAGEAASRRIMSVISGRLRGSRHHDVNSLRPFHAPIVAERKGALSRIPSSQRQASPERFQFRRSEQVASFSFSRMPTGSGLPAWSIV